MFSFSMWTLIEQLLGWENLNVGVFIVGMYLSEYYLGIYKTSMASSNQIMSRVFINFFYNFEEKITIAILVFMSRGWFLQIISNIQTIMAESIAAWCVYLEFYKHKKITRLLIPYLLSASLHSVEQIILIYRIGFLAIQRSKSVAQKVRRIVMLVIAAGGIYYVGRGYLTALIDKGNNYLSYAAEGTGYNYIWERVLSIYMIVIIVYIYCFITETQNESIVN